MFHRHRFRTANSLFWHPRHGTFLSISSLYSHEHHNGTYILSLSPWKSSPWNINIRTIKHVSYFIYISIIFFFFTVGVNHGWPSTQPGSLHTALQHKYTQPCNVNTHSRAHCSPGAWLCQQYGHGCVNNGARLCASAWLCRGSPMLMWLKFGIKIAVSNFSMPHLIPQLIFSNMTSDWLTAVLPANQKSC